jgi:hypothetical protein
MIAAIVEKWPIRGGVRARRWLRTFQPLLPEVE